ncbi:MAG TPA: dihydrolipoamide acetyltransferase family protein [Ktedonobacterales bacterium]|nr:dihydrolipoamide acetyltransferase family protein [Ktedonobacterales bacterium]
MATSITMPQLGESVAEGTVGRWLKHEGEMVKKDESLVEIITDKVTAELPSPVAGRLVKILVGEDQTVKIGVEIAQIEESGGAGSGSGGASATAGTSAPAGAPASASASATNGASASSVLSGFTSAAPAPAAAAPRATATMDKVSPLARRMAQEHNLDLNTITGTGENGRVRKEDILAFLAQRDQAQTATISPGPTFTPAPAAVAAPVAVSGEDQVITPSPARRAIAEHMARSKRTSPHATTVVEVDMTNLARWLDRNKDEFKRREGVGIGFQTFAIQAVAEALREHPYMNSSWTEDGRIVLRKAVNIGVSIALENNLVVPVIRNADTLNLVGIARAVADLVGRARANRLMPADLQGATFTVNNPGVFGTLISMAIINQPNAAILTMDAVVKRPVVIDDAIAIRSMMYMSLSFDHRILDGLTAAQFLGSVKRRLEAGVEGESH